MKKNRHRKVIFRADGNHDMGLGHVIRSLALVEMLKTNFDCSFLIRQPYPKLSSLIQSYCSVVELSAVTLDEEIEEIRGLLNSPDIVVTDGYIFDTSYQQFIKSTVQKLVMIDDKADKHYYADIIINHGDVSIKGKYSKENYTKVLTGFPYVIIRKEFLEAAKNKRKISKVDTAFICMGGADPYNITIKALHACLACAFIKRVIIVTGSAFDNKDELNEVINKKRVDKLLIHEEDITANRIVELMLMSEIVISPASSISLEVCSVKAGLITGTVIDNQAAIHKQLIDSQCCISLGDFKAIQIKDIKEYLQKLNNIESVNSLMLRQSSIIDGLSGERILNEFKHLIEC